MTQILEHFWPLSAPDIPIFWVETNRNPQKQNNPFFLLATVTFTRTFLALFNCQYCSSNQVNKANYGSVPGADHVMLFNGIYCGWTFSGVEFLLGERRTSIDRIDSDPRFKNSAKLSKMNNPESNFHET